MKRIEPEKVSVAGEDVGRPATNSEFEELVVLGVTTSYNLHIHLDPLSFARQNRQKDANVFLIDISVEPLSAQNFVELGEHCKGKQDLCLSQSEIERLARL